MAYFERDDTKGKETQKLLVITSSFRRQMAERIRNTCAASQASALKDRQSRGQMETYGI